MRSCSPNEHTAPVAAAPPAPSQFLEAAARPKNVYRGPSMIEKTLTLAKMLKNGFFGHFGPKKI